MDRLRDSLSGHERNKLFLNVGGQYIDLSGVSGCDDSGDGRAVVRFDYDRDGRIDLAVANSSFPRLVLAKNEIGSVGNFVVIDVAGANHNAEPSRRASNRDGIGTRLEAVLPSGRRLVREVRCGEGYAAQQSRLIHLGLGEEGRIERLIVRWPSGQKGEYSNLNVGTLVSIIEGQEKATSEVYRPE